MDIEGKIDTIIGKESVINGDLKSDSSVKIDGSIIGNVVIKEGAIIGRGAAIKGNLTCKTAIIGGKIEGNVEAQELLEFQPAAEMVGDIVCKGLIIQNGVFFEGNCHMATKTREKA